MPVITAATGLLARAGVVVLTAAAVLALLALPARADTGSCPPPLPGVVRSLPGTPRAIALTIDDGPHPTQTPALLEVLAAHDVRATFFVIGRNVRNHPELARRIVDEGHLIANHTFSHPTRPDHLETFPLPERAAELDRTTQIIERTTGVRPCFFRGPQGHHREPETIALAHERGMTVSGWNVPSGDTRQPPQLDRAAVDELIANVTEPLRRGGVLLFHDGGGEPKPNTAPAIDEVVRRYLDAGFDLVDPAGRPIPAVSERLRAICPPAVRLNHSFRDLAGDNPHLHAVACAADRGLMSGRSSTRFAPDEPITRGQLASVLDRHLRGARRLPTGPRTSFDDLDGSVHRAAVERLAGAGIVAGRGQGAFGPDEPVRRDQLASLLLAVLRDGHELTLVEGPGFPDVAVDNPHADAISRLAGIGVVSGVGGGRYDPAGPVTRAQAASAVMRKEAWLATR